MDNGDKSRGSTGTGEWTDELTLHFNSTTMRLHLSGHITSIDHALAMLAQATREYERQLRTQQAMQLQADLAQQARDAQIAAALRKH